MEAERLKHEYSLKTDGELLALLADSSLLSDEALPLLQQEITLRNISPRESDESVVPVSTPPAPALSRRRARWVGFWIASTLNATLGVAAATGSISYAIRPFAGHAIERYLMPMPLCPLAIAGAFIAGYFAFRRVQGSYSYWVWILPAAETAAAIISWKGAHQTSWISAFAHFVGPLPYREALLTQLGTTSMVFASLAYSMGAWVRTARHADSHTHERLNL